MRASVMQLVGLVIFIGCAGALSLFAGGAALGGAIVYVGLAMERD